MQLLLQEGNSVELPEVATSSAILENQLQAPAGNMQGIPVPYSYQLPTDMFSVPLADESSTRVTTTSIHS